MHHAPSLQQNILHHIARLACGHDEDLHILRLQGLAN
jgi:hypothetical protein